MFIRSTKNSRERRRLIGVGILLFVFFLPLHRHAFTPTAQLANECACIHGARAQLAPSTQSPTSVPLLAVQLVVVQTSSLQSFECFESQCARGPPALLSI